MEDREDLRSILPYLPVVLRSSSLLWPSQVVEALRALSRGPEHSRVDSGEVLFLAISDMRQSLCLNVQSESLASSAADGYALFFDDLMSRLESAKWFGAVLPALATLLLRLPSLLETHYQNADGLISRGKDRVKTGLRLLDSQEPGIVLLTQVYRSGLIEDKSSGALEVDFANKYIGGGALHGGCVQEEIRFMINPELIAGMLFLPSMADNEAIEITGTERFSNYSGYASSFRFAGDYVDKRYLDHMGRRKTRIIAIDALCSPGKRQYGLEYLLREVNKAFCGFFDQSKCQQYRRLFMDDRFCIYQLDQGVGGPSGTSENKTLFQEAVSNSFETNEGILRDKLIRNFDENDSQCVDPQNEIGIITGNWGCGAFGGDPELKAIIQWLAASQALRPFISYCTLGVEALQTLDQVSQWILSHKWTVGDLWNMLVEYSSQRFTGKTNLGFLNWLLPSSAAGDAMILDVPQES